MVRAEMTGVAANEIRNPEIDYSHHYRHWHDDSDAHFNDMANYFADKLKPLLPSQQPLRIFEIGCGTGFALRGLQLLGYQDIEGVDADRHQVDSAQRRNLPATYVPASQTSLRLETCADCYDVILCIDVLEHIPVSEQLSFLIQLRRTLKPGGRLICQVPNANSSISGRYRYIDWTHHCSFSETSLDFVLHNAGFAVDSIMEADPRKRPRSPLHLRPELLGWLLYKLFHLTRKLEYIAELGYSEGHSIPLTPNILAIAKRNDVVQQIT
jgi:SAM-dependent methyltransferase